jgi:hypothetical protein
VTALGPLAGGGLEELVGWRPVVALPALGLLVVPVLWKAVPTLGSGARLDLLGAVLVALTAAGLVLLVQSAAPAVAVVARRRLLALGVPRRRAGAPAGRGLPAARVVRKAVVRSALAASAVPAPGSRPAHRRPRRAVARGWSRCGGLALVPSAHRAARAPGSPRRCWCASGQPLAGGVRAWPRRGGRVAGGARRTRSRRCWCAVVVAVDLRLRLGPARAHAGGRARRSRRTCAGVALGLATLVFLVGGGVGSPSSAGLGEVLGCRSACWCWRPCPSGECSP